ncbi:MAG: DUF4026 domain-containing protein [Archangium sp.]|nr:DUF4026 domain-containing protein [Archangium sp.]
MPLPDRYQQFLASPRPPSPMWAWLPASEEAPTATAAMAALTARFGAGLSMQMESPPKAPGAAWEINCRVPQGRTFSVWAQRSEKVETLHLQNDHHVLSEAEKQDLASSVWSLGVVLVFGDAPLDDFHFQLQALIAVAPQAVAAFDVAAYRLHHAEWVKESARSAAPPSPTSLFVMHFVSDAGKPGWIHTHGLDRCGRLELELFDITPDASRLLSELVNSTAAFFLEQGLPAPGETVEVGRDLPLLWLPWEEALSRVAPRHGGGKADRDAVHGNPTAVLFAPGKKFLGFFGSGLASAASHLPVLEGSPILYVSNSHTRRMEVLSRERLPTLKALFGKLGGNEQFKFLVKLGYPTADPEQFGSREHIWFEVHSFGGEHVDATCINQPHSVPALREGLRGLHALSLISDWTIFCPVGRFDAERVGLLVHVLESAPDELRTQLGL